MPEVFDWISIWRFRGCIPPINSLISSYVAIVTEAHTTRVGNMLAYMRLVVREASKFGGSEWLTYGAVFRQNQVDPSMPWNYIDASLHQVYIANQQGRMATPCKHCNEVEHSSADCVVVAISHGKERPARHRGQQHQTVYHQKANSLPHTPTSNPYAPLGTAKLQIPREVLIRSCLLQLLWYPPCKEQPLATTSGTGRPAPRAAGRTSSW